MARYYDWDTIMEPEEYLALSEEDQINALKLTLRHLGRKGELKIMTDEEKKAAIAKCKVESQRHREAVIAGKKRGGAKTC